MPWIKKSNSAKPWITEWIYRTPTVKQEHTWRPPSARHNIMSHLPNELLERIMRHCENAPSYDPHSRYYMHDLCAMARVCRVINRAATPILYSGFKSYHTVEWDSHNLTDKRPALLLLTLLEKPELGNYFNIIELTEKYVSDCWIDPENRQNCGVDMRLFKKRTRAGRKAFDALGAKVKILCALPIWRFPAGQRTSCCNWGMFQDAVRDGEKGADHSSQPAVAVYNEGSFRKAWMRALMYGQYDAVYALILCLTTEIQTLQINAWMVNWSKLEPRGAPPQGLVIDFLSQLMRAAAVAQQEGVEYPILQKLNHVKLYSYAEEADKPIALAVPYLLPPSVSEATLSGLWDAQWFTNLPGPDGARPYKGNEASQHPPKLALSFHLKKLRIRNSMLHPHSLGKLLTCCEGLEWFSYSQYKQILADERLINADGNAQGDTAPEPVEDMGLHVHTLQPYLDEFKETLRYLDFATNAEEDKRWWDLRTDRMDKWEIWRGFFNLSGFEKLEEVYLLSENLQHWGPQMDADDYDDFAAVLPLECLKKLAIHNSLWTREWYGPDLTKETRTRDTEGRLQGYFESRMERYAESFVRLFEGNERRRKEGKTFRKVALEEMVWVGQGDRDGEEAFYGMRFPVVRRLRSLCAKNGILFEFKNAEKDRKGFEQEEEVEKEENDHVGRIGYAVSPNVERALEANSQSPEPGVIYPGSIYDPERDEGDEWVLAGKPIHRVVVKQELDPTCMDTLKLWYNPISGTGTLMQEFYREPQGPAKLADHMDEKPITELIGENNRAAEEATELQVAIEYLVSQGKLPGPTVQEEGQEDNMDTIPPEEENLDIQDIVNFLSQTHKPVVWESIQNKYQKDQAGNLHYPPKQKILERNERVRVRQWNWSEFQVIRCGANARMPEREPTYEEYDEEGEGLDEQELRALGNIGEGRRTNMIGFRREARVQRRLRREDEMRRREEEEEYQRRRREADELMNSMPARRERREDEGLDDLDRPSSWDGLDDGEDEQDVDEDDLGGVSRRRSRSRRTKWRNSMKTRMTWRLRLRWMSRSWSQQIRLSRRKGGGVLSRRRRMRRMSMRLIARRLRGRGGEDEDREDDGDEDDEDVTDASPVDPHELENQTDEQAGAEDEDEDEVDGASPLVEQELEAAENVISSQSRKRPQRETEDKDEGGGHETDRSTSPRRKRRRTEEPKEDEGDCEDASMESSDGEYGRRELYEDPFQ